MSLWPLICRRCNKGNALETEQRYNLLLIQYNILIQYNTIQYNTIYKRFYSQNPQETRVGQAPNVRDSYSELCGATGPCNVKSTKKIHVINRDMNAPLHYNCNTKFGSQVIFKCHNTDFTLSWREFHRVGAATGKRPRYMVVLILGMKRRKNVMHFINQVNSVIRLPTHPSSWHLLKEKINILVIAS